MSMILACPSARGAWGAVEVRASPLIWAGAEASPTAAPLLIWGIAMEPAVERRREVEPELYRAFKQGFDGDLTLPTPRPL
jgi:hypothetical protein